MKRLAIPITNKVLSNSFIDCLHLDVFEIDGAQVRMRTFERDRNLNPEYLSQWMEELGITDIITHRIDKEILVKLASKKRNIFVGVPLATSEQLFKNFRNGTLVSDKKIIQEIIN